LNKILKDYSPLTRRPPTSVQNTSPTAVASASTGRSVGSMGTAAMTCGEYASASSGGMAHPAAAHRASYRSMNAAHRAAAG